MSKGGQRRARSTRFCITRVLGAVSGDLDILFASNCAIRSSAWGDAMAKPRGYTSEGSVALAWRRSSISPSLARFGGVAIDCTFLDGRYSSVCAHGGRSARLTDAAWWPAVHLEVTCIPDRTRCCARVWLRTPTTILLW